MTTTLRRRLVLSLALLLAASASRTQAENWPNWRGPQNNGLSRETNLPLKWSQTENVAWRFPLPGPAGATPVVWDDHIFLTTVDGEKLLLICVTTDGKEKWRRQVGSGNKDSRGDEGNSASPSPVTDGNYVWSFMGSGDLACYDFDGNEVWKFNAQDRYGKFKIAFGMTSTPVQHQGRLYLQLIHGEGKAETREAKVACVEGATGKAVWEVDRPSDAHSENEHSYASPMIYNDGKLAFLLTHGADFLVAHDLDTGKEIWRTGGLNLKTKYDPTLRFVASPACAPGIIIVPSAKKGPVLAIRPDFQGDITDSKEAILWTYGETPDVPSPLIDVESGLVYLCMQNGNFHILDLKTGEEISKSRTYVQRHRASPVMADGKIYLTARDGKVTVVKPGREFEILAQNDMEESISSSPAIADGTIYLRSFDALYAIRNGK